MHNSHSMYYMCYWNIFLQQHFSLLVDLSFQFILKHYCPNLHPMYFAMCLMS